MITNIENVKKWANERNLIDGGCAKSQTLKLMSEVGELSDNINKQKNITDDIGDILVVLIILAAMNDLEIWYCLDVAYNDIKDRKGILLDGVFIKEYDPAYDGALAVLAARRVHEVRS